MREVCQRPGCGHVERVHENGNQCLVQIPGGTELCACSHFQADPEQVLADSEAAWKGWAAREYGLPVFVPPENAAPLLEGAFRAGYFAAKGITPFRLGFTTPAQENE